MPKQTLQQFGQTVKAKHPEYSDMSDEDVAQKVIAKYPQYGDMVDATPALPAGATGPLPGAPAAPLPGGITGNAGQSPDAATRLLGSPDGSDLIKAIPRHAVSAAKGARQMAAHPFDTIKTLAQQTVDAGNRVNPAVKRGDYAGAANAVMDAIPVVGPWARSVEDEAKQHGALPALMGLGTDVLSGEGLSEVPKLPGAIKGKLVGAADELAPGAATTPRQNYEAAKRLGVNLDAADATGSGLFKGVKKLNEHSLLGFGVYEKTRGANLAALDAATEDTLNTMSPLDRESGGKLIQEKLRANQQGLQADATTGFQALPKDYQIPGSIPLGETAQDIAAKQAAYQQQFPSLKPSKAMEVVGDVSKLGPKKVGPPQMSGLVDAQGNALPSTAQPPTARPSDFGTIQQLRSDLLDLGRTNPDLVQNQSGGWFKQLSGGADAAITDAGSGLPPAEQAMFRDANAKWADMKQTYDDPSSPLYSAVRTPNVSNLPTSVMGRTPEQVRNVSGRVGPEGVGAAQRAVAEKAMGTTSEGQRNFKTFGTQWNRLPADFRDALYGPRGNSLNDIATTGTILNRDVNPSGTMKLAQKLTEGSALVGGFVNPLSAIEPLAQYPVAKFMNSPKVVDYLMQPRQAPKLGNYGKFSRGAAYSSANARPNLDGIRPLANAQQAVETKGIPTPQGDGKKPGRIVYGAYAGTGPFTRAVNRGK